MTKYFLTTLSALCLLSFSVCAADKSNWEGFYGSALIGYSVGTVHENDGYSEYSDGSRFKAYSAGEKSFAGFNGSLKFGYNFELPESNLIGVELGATLQNAKSNKRSYFGYQDLSNGANFYDDGNLPLMTKTKVNNYETLALRFGHIFNDTLIYGLAGAAVGKVERKVTQLNDDYWFDPGYCVKQRKTEMGYVIGFGVEHKITSRWSLRANYEYVDFGKIKMTSSGPWNTGGINPLNDNLHQKFKMSFSNFAVGASYQF